MTIEERNTLAAGGLAFDPGGREENAQRKALALTTEEKTLHSAGFPLV
jgi:hypothetical protein